MRTKKNIVHRRHSIKRNVLDKIKSRSRKNNAKFNNTSKTKLRKRHFNNQSAGGKENKLNKFKKSNCKLSIEDISKDNCLYNLVVEAIYGTVEKFLGEESGNKTRKELYNSIKESVVGVLMHFVKFRDENGNLLVTNHSELDDILDFFTIFFIVKIYLSKEENTMRLRNFLEENFLTGNYASDLEMTKRELTALENMLREQAGSFMSPASVESLISNISSDSGFASINYDNFSSEGSQLYGPGPGSLYSEIDEGVEYDNADAFISGTPVQVGVDNPLYYVISKQQNTYAEAGLVTQEKLKQVLAKSERQKEETYASRRALFEKLQNASATGRSNSLAEPLAEEASNNAYDEVQMNEDQRLLLETIKQAGDVKRLQKLQNMYVGASGSSPSQSEKPLVVMVHGNLNYNQVTPEGAGEYTRLTPRVEVQDGQKVRSEPNAPYDVLSKKKRERLVDIEVLKAAALYERSRINVDKIQTKEKGEALIRRHLKTAKTIEKIIILRDIMNQLYKKFESGTVRALSGVSGYYESAGTGVRSQYVEADPLPDGYYEADPLPEENDSPPGNENENPLNGVEEEGGENSTSPSPSPPPPRPPVDTKPKIRSSLPRFEADFKTIVIDNIDSDVYPTFFSVAGVYEKDLMGNTLSAKEIPIFYEHLNSFIAGFPKELKKNWNFTQFNDKVKEKVKENCNKVNDRSKILRYINTLGTDFLTNFRETQSLVSFAKAAAEKISSTELQTYADLLKRYSIIIKLSDELFECFNLLRAQRIEAMWHNDIGVPLFILFFMTVINNVYVGALKKYFRKSLRTFISMVREEGNKVGGGGEEEEEEGKESSKLEFNLDSNVIRMLKEYVTVYAELDSDNKKLAGNFTNIIPILISRSMKGGFISPFIRNFKNAIKKSSVTSLNPSDFNLVNHIFFIKKKNRSFKYDNDNESPQQVESERAMTTYTFGSDLQNTFDITALGTIKTGKKLSSPIKPKQSLSNKYFIEAPNNSNIKTRILGSNYTKQSIKTAEDFVELLEIKLEDIKKKGIVANFHTALETSNELKVEELHSYSYRLYSEQDLSKAVPDTSLYAQTQIVSELFNALKHSVVNK